MKDTQHNGRSKSAMSGGRRLAWGAGIGVLLFAIGYGLNAKGWLSFSLGSPDEGTSQLGEATYSRAAMEADRKTQSKDKLAVTAGLPVGADGYYLPLQRAAFRIPLMVKRFVAVALFLWKPPRPCRITWATPWPV